MMHQDSNIVPSVYLSEQDIQKIITATAKRMQGYKNQLWDHWTPEAWERYWNCPDMDTDPFSIHSWVLRFAYTTVSQTEEGMKLRRGKAVFMEFINSLPLEDADAVTKYLYSDRVI